MEFFNRLSKRERKIAYLVIVLIAGVFFDKVAFRPVMRKLESLNGETQVQVKKLEKSLYIVLQEKPISGEYNKFVQNIKQTQSDEETVAALLSSIEKMANSVSVTIQDMKPSLVEKFEFYKKYAIKIQAEAKISNLADFIYQLENSPQLLRVADFRLTPQKKESFLKIDLTVTEVLII